MADLKSCPCGEVPDRLYVEEGPTAKWSFVVGSCCGAWYFEFRTHYLTDRKTLLELATDAWNDAPRKQ